MANSNIIESAEHYLRRELDQLMDRGVKPASTMADFSHVNTFEDTLNIMRRATADELEQAAKRLRERADG